MCEQWAVVTGGACNIGRVISRRLADDGFKVIVTDIVPPEDPDLRTHAVLVDLSDRAAAVVAFAQVPRTLPSLFWSIMSASFAPRSLTTSTSTISMR